MNAGSSLPNVGHSVEFRRAILDSDVALFADLSGDRDLIHVDEQYAAQTRFEGRVVHGAFLLGLVGTALTELSGSGYAWLGATFRFRAPVRVGESVLVQARVTRLRVDKPIVTVAISVARETGEVALDGEAGLMRLD